MTTVEILAEKSATLRAETHARVLELAERLEKARMFYDAFGAMNTYSLSTEEKIAHSVRYRLALDAWHKAEDEYRDAVSILSVEELTALASAKTARKEAA